MNDDLEKNYNLELSKQEFGQQQWAEPDGNLRLIDLVKRFDNGEIKLAPHQRGVQAWAKSSRKKWIDRLGQVVSGTAQPPLGTICLYTVEAENCRQIYLNDGAQRISTVSEALKCSNDYNRAQVDMERLVNAVFLYVQNRRYHTHLPAAHDFCSVNEGRSLLPSEKHKWRLVYIDGWETLWRQELDRWHFAIEKALAPFARGHNARSAKIAERRADLFLFVVAHTNRGIKISRGPEVEDAVATCLKTTSPNQINRLIEQIDRLSSEIYRAWINYRPHESDRMQASFARWCLGVMLLHENKMSPIWWQDFFLKLFNQTSGKSSFNCTSAVTGKRFNEVLSGVRIRCFASVCEAMDLVPPETKKRKKSKRLLAAGWQAHHPMPFVDYGEGPTEPLPARLNAALNARGGNLPDKDSSGVDDDKPV